MEAESRLRRNLLAVLFACGLQPEQAETLLPTCRALLGRMAVAALDFESLSRVRSAAGPRQQLLLLHYCTRVFPFECFVFFETLRCRHLFDSSLAGGRGQRLERLLRRLARREFSPEFVERRRSHAAFVQARSQLVAARGLIQLEEAKRATLLRGMNVVEYLEGTVHFRLPLLGKKALFPRLFDYCLTASFKELMERAAGEPAHAGRVGMAELEIEGEKVVTLLDQRAARYRRVADEGFQRKAFGLFRAEFSLYLDVILAQSQRLLRPTTPAPVFLDYVDSPQKLWKDVVPMAKNAFLERYIVQKRVWRAWKERPEAGLSGAAVRASDALRNSTLARLAKTKLRGCDLKAMAVPDKARFQALFGEMFKFWFLKLCGGDESSTAAAPPLLRLEALATNGP